MHGGQKLAIYSTVWAATEVDVPCRNPALNPAVKRSKLSQVRGAGHQVENIRGVGHGGERRITVRGQS